MMCELDDLVAGEVIDIRANVGDHLRGHVLVMLLRWKSIVATTFASRIGSTLKVCRVVESGI